MANHDAVAALPITGAPSQTLLRNVNVARMPYVLFDADDSRTITFTDPTTGAKTIDLLLFGRVFHYDPTDTTTAHDGTSCLVSLDGLRYKLALGSDVFAYAVLDNTIATPPVSPALGDAYLVAAAATGAWVGKSNYIAVKTNRGWEFVNFGIGRFIYVESVDTYYHKNSGGAWVTGFGNQTVIANSVPLSAAINFGKRVIVENQTTTSPPGSPTVGTAYIIGPSATGGWSGLDTKIAICEVAGSFVVYTPTNGWGAYDKALSNEYHFNGSAWISSAGRFIDGATASYSANAALTALMLCDDTIPQITTGTQIISLPYTCKSTTAKIQLRFNGECTLGAGGHFFAVAFFLNSNANAIAAAVGYIETSDHPMSINIFHEFVPGTTSPITISVRAGGAASTLKFNGTTAGRLLGGTSAAWLTLDEIAS
jgi:hypothetical protein